MEYMVLIYSDENYERPAPGAPGFDEMMAQWSEYNQQLIDGGHWISGANLQPTATATVVGKSWDGSSSVTDGPYVETKEQLGGFYLIKAADLDEALALATAIPIPVAHLEVRPVSFRPDAA